jgi:hypothetical protein
MTGKANPIGALAVQLASPKRDGGQGMSMREAAAAAKAAKRFAPEHPAWARALEQWPGTAAKRVVDSMVDLEAVARWRWSLGTLKTEQELDAVIARLRAANEWAGDALAELVAVNRAPDRGR